MNGVFSCFTQQWCRVSAGLLSSCIPHHFRPCKKKEKKKTHAAESVFHMFMEDVVELFCEELFHCTKQCGFQL